MPRELKETQLYSSVGKKKVRANVSNIGEPIRTRKGKLAGRGKHDARLDRVEQVKKRGGGNPLFLNQRE